MELAHARRVYGISCESSSRVELKARDRGAGRPVNQATLRATDSGHNRIPKVAVEPVTGTADVGVDDVRVRSNVDDQDLLLTVRVGDHPDTLVRVSTQLQGVSALEPHCTNSFNAAPEHFRPRA